MTSTYIPSELPVSKVHALLLGAIGPRPICFASTIDAQGNVNLSPFSFFNVFGSNPPMVIFSPAVNGRTGRIKDTLLNAKETHEVVINVVNYDMVYQMSLASCEYQKGINEFDKAGFTMLKSDGVKPYRVAESPVQMECTVSQIIETGKGGGAGNLIICKVEKIHVNDNILDANGYIDPLKIDLVARMGADWYTRAKMGLFEVEKPLSSNGIGVDAIPAQIRNSKFLTGNDLGRLGNVVALPTVQEIADYEVQNKRVIEIRKSETMTLEEKQDALHIYAKSLIDSSLTIDAWKTLLANISS